MAALTLDHLGDVTFLPPRVREKTLGVLLACQKRRISFWEYLGHPIHVPITKTPYLPGLVRLRSAPACMLGLLPHLPEDS